MEERTHDIIERKVQARHQIRRPRKGKKWDGWKKA